MPCIDGSRRISEHILGVRSRPVRASEIGGAQAFPAAGHRSVVLPASQRAGRQVATGGTAKVAANRKELAVDRAAKKELVATLNGVFKGTTVVVVAQNSGLTVAQMQALRRQARQAGAAVKVTKNRLTNVA